MECNCKADCDELGGKFLCKNEGSWKGTGLGYTPLSRWHADRGITDSSIHSAYKDKISESLSLSRLWADKNTKLCESRVGKSRFGLRSLFALRLPREACKPWTIFAMTIICFPLMFEEICCYFRCVLWDRLCDVVSSLYCSGLFDVSIWYSGFWATQHPTLYRELWLLCALPYTSIRFKVVCEIWKLGS